MFKEFFIKEIITALKRPMIYIFLLIISLLVFAAVVSDNVVIGGTVGNVYKNAPHVITNYVAILSIFGLMIATAFFNSAALRDYENGFNEILFSTPIKKSVYFFGRFFGALVLSTIPLLGVFIGFYFGSIIGPAAGWIDADRIGPFYAASFINNYLLFILPNMFFAGAIIFAMANKWKSTVISFVGTLIIIIGYIVSGTLLSDIENEVIGALADTFGIRAYSIDAKYFTPIEKNTISVGFDGLLLYNRILWSALGAIVLFLSYLSFSFTEKQRKAKEIKAEKKNTVLFKLPTVSLNFNMASQFAIFKSFLKINLLSILKSTTFKILFAFSAIILISNFFGGFEYFGLKSYPLTYIMIDEINGVSAIFVIIILVFFSGELIWKDRASHINEVIDATPHFSITSLISKALSLVVVTSLINLFLIVIAILYQLLNGFTRIELDVYFLDFIYNSLPKYVTWSMILIFIQVAINNKYLGYFISIIFLFLLDIIFLMLKIETNMIKVGATPSSTYSDMNSFGPALTGVLWFNSYWLLFGLMFLLFAGLLWIRGIAGGFMSRFKSSGKQFSKKYTFIIAMSVIAWLSVLMVVYYNTQVLNKYKTSDEFEKLQAEYEKTYKKYENVNLPKITTTQYHIDIFPESRNVNVLVGIKMVNKTNTPIDSLHFTIDRKWNQKVHLKNAKLVLNDEKFDYLIYQLDQPLMPNESLNMVVQASCVTVGFENEVSNTSVVKNGTFFNNFDILPNLGYNESYEIGDKNTRKKYDLPEKNRMPELESNCGKNCMVNYLSNGRADWVNVETFISTSSKQIAIAPGTLVKEWKDGDRNHYQYKLDHPSQNFYAFMSAEYEVARRKWNGIDLEVYYNNKHTDNIEMMLNALEKSLKYYTEHFGPYYHKQARIIEFPRYASFAQAFPGTMPYSESLGFIINLEDEEDNNVIDAVIAHEMGHQWWAHQVVGATMQGSTMLSESFAEYSALIVMKNSVKDSVKMKEFLKYDLNRYLRGRSSEVEKELPLYKVENQGHIHYGKGSVIMYALQDYIGESVVNAALKGFLEEYRYKEPPYPTSLDFLKHLEPRVPDSLKYLITDWFKEITLYDFRLKEATYKKVNSKYEVSLNIEAYKLKADTIGNETKVKLNDWVDIGVYADADEKKLLFEKRVKFNKQQMNFTFLMDSLPVKAAIDPRKILIERVYDDNVKSLSVNE